MLSLTYPLSPAPKRTGLATDASGIVRAVTIATHGLSHLSLAVRDLDRGRRFYAVFGFAEYFRDAKCVQLLGPAGRDVIALELMPEHAGAVGGVRHFGFRLLRAEDIDAAVEAAVAAGGTLQRRGSFAPGCPYAYVTDPDGYTVELWFE